MSTTRNLCRLAVLFCLTWLGSSNEALAQGKKSDAVVKVKAVAGKDTAEGTTPITLTLTIDPGWHLYANPVGNDGLDDNATTVTAGGGAKAERVQYPEGKKVDDKTLGAYKIYTDEVKINVKARRPAGGGPIELNIKVQACNESRCLVPATIKTTVP
jgi:DsbC/DsbD-like thiol-disulfide interchange protein